MQVRCRFEGFPGAGAGFFLGMLATFLLAAPAQAGNPPVNANFFRPAVHPGSLLNVETTLMADPMDWGVGAWFSYEHKSLRLEDTRGGGEYQILRDVLKADVYGHFAPTRWLDIGLDVPVFLYLRGDRLPSVVPLSQIGGSALGDLRLGLKFRALGRNGEGFGLAVTEDLTFPTATGRVLAGDRLVTSTTLLVGGFNRRGWNVALNAGVRLKAPVNFLGTETGHQMLLGLGLSAPLVCGTMEAFGTAEIRTRLTSPFQSAQQDSLDLMAGVRGRVGPVVLSAAAGAGILAGFGSPLTRAVLGVTYAPPLEAVCTAAGDPGWSRARRQAPVLPPPQAAVAAPAPEARAARQDDRDNDGFPNEQDGCPDLAGVANPDRRYNGCPPDRDGDGVIDALDGCPDLPGSDLAGRDRLGCPPDRDGDGVPDPLDACPDDAGIRVGDPTQDGCPPYSLVRKVEIRERVEFEEGRSRLRPDVLATLDRVARLLIDHPEVRLVRVEGYNDNTIAYDEGLRLSGARAKAVRDYLVRKGVAAARLEAEGFADALPLGNNRTPEGRQRNNRVEFRIMSRAPEGAAP